MIEKLKNFFQNNGAAKSFSIYFTSNVFNRAIPFLVLPIISRFFTPEDFGKLAVFSAIYTFISPAIHLVLYSFINVQFFQKSKDYVAKMIFNMLLVIFICTILSSILLLVSRYFFGDFLSFHWSYYVLIPMLVFMHNVKAINLAILRNNDKPVAFGVINVLATLSELAISLSFIVLLLYNWEGRINGMVLSSFLMLLICVYSLKKEGFLKPVISKSIISENIKFSLPLIPTVIAISFVNHVDTFFIKTFAGESELGLYAIGSSFGMIITFLLFAFEQISVPWLYKTLGAEGENSPKVKLVKFTYLYVIMVLIMVILVTIGSYILFELHFLPEQYKGARNYIFFIALAYGLWGMSLVISPYIGYLKKTIYSLIATLIGCVFNLIANYYFISWYGTIGAAYSKVLTFLIILIAYWYFANRIFPMPWFRKDTFNITKADLKEIAKMTT